VNRRVGMAALVIGVLMAVGCGNARGPYSTDGSQTRDVAKAEERYQTAVTLLSTPKPDDQEIEHLLREALGFDLYHGAAHNNLGVLLLKQDRLYDAAEEFEWARKLLPGHPEPRVNLAIALERGGKHREALDAARTALEVRPGNLAAIKAIAVIQIHEAMTDETTRGHLDTIVTRSTDPAWRAWAEQQRLKLDAVSPLERK
jgi:tetratricopeptide (TPR) repeat protein